MKVLQFVAILALLGCASTSGVAPVEADRGLSDSGDHVQRRIFEPIAYIPNPALYSKIFVVSDVHGMLPELLALLLTAEVIDRHQNWSAGKSLFLVLGDSVDKGPYSVETIRFWMKLQTGARAAGGELIHLLGNHEAEFMANPNNAKADAFRESLAHNHLTAAQFLNPAQDTGKFLREMPIAIRVGNWFMAHAGYVAEATFNAFAADAKRAFALGTYNQPFFLHEESILESKEWWQINSPKRRAMLSRMNAAGIFGVVFGHQPAALGVKKKLAITRDFRMIKTDSGMSPEASATKGRILLFPNPAELLTRTLVHAGAIHSQEPGIESLSMEDPSHYEPDSN